MRGGQIRKNYPRSIPSGLTSDAAVVQRGGRESICGPDDSGNSFLGKVFPKPFSLIVAGF